MRFSSAFDKTPYSARSLKRGTLDYLASGPSGGGITFIIHNHISSLSWRSIHSTVGTGLRMTQLLVTFAGNGVIRLQDVPVARPSVRVEGEADLPSELLAGIVPHRFQACDDLFLPFFRRPVAQGMHHLIPHALVGIVGHLKDARPHLVDLLPDLTRTEFFEG